ncbi:MAG: PIN domain-containing protein [Peptostreptococcaceae bacterium]
MSLTIGLISNRLGIPVDKTLENLKQNGIYIQDPNRELTELEIEKIKVIIKKQNDSFQDTKNVMNSYAKNYKIFIDTCSLMDNNIENFYKNIYPYLEKYSNKIIVPHRVIDELKKHFNSDNIERNTKAKKGLYILKKLQDKNLIDIKGEDTDNFADNVFLVVFTKSLFRIFLTIVSKNQ